MCCLKWYISVNKNYLYFILLYLQQSLDDCEPCTLVHSYAIVKCVSHSDWDFQIINMYTGTGYMLAISNGENIIDQRLTRGIMFVYKL